MRCLITPFFVAPLASALVSVKDPHVIFSAVTQKSEVHEQACTAEDLKHRAQLQNKIAGICEEMCKEVQAYPKCTCPGFVEPDSTPGVMTWEELLTYMDDLAQWGRDSIKGWHKQASQLQLGKNTTVTGKNGTAASGKNGTDVSSKKTKICLASELYWAPSSSDGGSGGQGAFTEVTAGAGVCVSTTDGVAIKLCGPGKVEAFGTAACAGSAVTLELGLNKTAADCDKVEGSFVSLKYTCGVGNAR